jgi:hypothetical protein
MTLPPSATTFSLSELIQIETERQVLGAPLHSAAVPVVPGAAPQAAAPSHASRKETIHAGPTRTAQ